MEILHYGPNGLWTESKAKVADVLRCSQRDEEFVSLFQEYITTFFSYFSPRNTLLLQKYSSVFASLWYYLLTTLSNLQTLGEEYTGVLRIKNRNIPNRWIQALWLALHIGGEPLVNNMLNKWSKQISSSTSLTANAKSKLSYTIAFLKENKHILLRLHQSLFYMNGSYYFLSNRLTGIQYVLIRKWLQDDSSTYSFNLLGKLSFVYLIVALVQKHKYNQLTGENYSFDSGDLDVSVSYETSGCALCGSTRTNTCSTPCGHLFCWNCIFECLSYQQNCPVCREIVKPSRVVYLQNYT